MAIEKTATSIQRLTDLFRGALSSLGCALDDGHLEGCAVLVHACMSGQGRAFHNVEHVFDVAEGADPVGTLAALFHDTVYVQVDGGLGALEPILADAIEMGPEGIHLSPVPESDAVRGVVVAVFGFTNGQVLSPFAGLNELLSALLAARELGEALPLAVHAQIAACIEATIPFRRPDDQGRSAADRLERRLLALDVRAGLGLGPEGVRAAVARGVAVGNRDVANFAFADAGAFLANTWALLPETNATLRAHAYTVGEYLAAMRKMEGFFASLDPEAVFTSFHGEPGAEELERLTAMARRNLDLGRRYLRAKLLAAAVLRALAEATGGDAPMALFMGDLPQDEPGSARMEDSLSAAPAGASSDVQAEVLALLRDGRPRPSGFDLKNAPLAAYLYAVLGDAGIERAVRLQRSARPGVEGARALLSELPAPVLREVIDACASVATTRAGRLRALARGAP